MPDVRVSPARGLQALEALAVRFERLSARSVGHPRPTRPSRPLSLCVTGVRREAAGVIGVTFAGDGALPGWEPGAHLDLVLPSGRLRQYSLCGDPRDRDEYRIAVRLLGPASTEVHALKIGDELIVRGPRNAFPFLAVPRYLFVAGGIGITPIRAMVRDAARRGADWQLVYTGRTRDTMPFVDELLALDAQRVHIRPDDTQGLPDPKRIVDLAPHGSALYACGPPQMIAAVRRQLPDHRIATLHYERFSPLPVIGGAPFEIELARTGRVLTVGSDQTALTAIRAVLPDVVYSCQQGFCGTCHVRVLGGNEPSMAICVARAESRVVLDL
jgi:ferredoxin-NADP reductase